VRLDSGGGEMRITPEQLLDQRWRLSNLYHIISDSGHDVLFQMNNVQGQFIEDMWYRNVILKSRKHGITTLVAVMGLDRALWEGNQDCQFISDTMVGAMRIFRRIIKYSYDHLPAEIKATIPVESETQTQLVFANGSIISVGTSSRSTSPTFLEVSEYGRISAKWPEKAREILTGAIQAVASTGDQMVFVESTAMGKIGAYKDMVDRAKKIRDSGKHPSKLDMKLLFYPWYAKKDNRLFESEQIISPVMEEYFTKLGVPLDMEQKKWYATQYEILGPDMLVENPSTEDEPFTVAIDGAYFAHQFRRVYAEKRVGRFEMVSGLPVDTSWDIGMHDYMAIWFWQEVDGFIRAVDYYENSGQGLEHYVRVLEGRGYRYGVHYAPHDVNVKEVGTGKSRLESAADLGLRFKAVPRIGQKMDAIESARRMMDHCQFDEVRCDEAIVHLEQYRKKWNPLQNCWSDEPAKTGDDHCADAFMTLAQGKTFNWKVGQVLKESGESAWTKGKWG
jgi:hypothetical protein